MISVHQSISAGAVTLSDTGFLDLAPLPHVLVESAPRLQLPVQAIKQSDAGKIALGLA